MSARFNNRYLFDDFELDSERRLLLRRGEPVTLPGKTLDLLLVLVENRGKIVSKDDLLSQVWEDQFVEENNLTVHVATLRKAFGETKSDHRYIATVSGKGYRFVAPVTDVPAGDLIVETTTTFESIVVDEKIEEYSAGHAAPVRSTEIAESGVGTSRQRTDNRRTLLFAFAGVVLILAATGYAFRDRLLSGFAPAARFGEHGLTQLTTSGNIGNAALSPDGKLFAYVIDDLGQKSLWLGFTEGGNHLQLRPAAEATYRTLAFSPDSSQLFFSIRDEKNPKGTLFRMPVSGGVPVEVLSGVGNFSLSPDGTRIARGRIDDEDEVLVISALDGSDSRDVASFPKSLPFKFESISWSADGTRLAMSAVKENRVYRDELAFVDVATGDVSRLQLKNYRQITNTAWLSDGSGLVVTAIEGTSHSSVPQYQLIQVSYPDGAVKQITVDRSNYGESWHNDAGATLSLDASGTLLLSVEHRQLSNVWIAPADDLGASRQVTFSAFGRYDGLWGIDWTPDGRLIYTTSDTRSQYLAEMNSDGTVQKALTPPGHVDSVLTVSADGRYILFHSNRAGDSFNIWRADIDGSNPERLTFGSKDFHPAPSPDGRWVYYKSYVNDVPRLCRIPMKGGDPECVNDKETSWISFSPDGKYLAASYITDKQRLAIISAETHQVVRQFELPKTGTLFMGSRWTADGSGVTYRDTAYGYWVQPVVGGEPYRLVGLPKEKFYNFSWSRDGKWLAFVRGQEIRDVVLFRRTNQ